MRKLLNRAPRALTGVVWRAVVLGILLTGALLVGGCAAPLQPAAPNPEQSTLRIALLPVMDVLPYHVAQQEGYFADEGVTVEGVPVKSAQERDTLMQTGQVDAQLTDLVGPVFFNQETPRVKVIYTARRAYPDSPMFRILAASGSGLDTAADLAGVPVGISQNTVIEYLTDRMLLAEGLDLDDLETVEVSAIPVRFELLMKGELQAATLPDPLASGGIAAGANLIVDDSSYPQYAQSVLVFSVDALTGKPEAVRRFVRAWDRAAGEINANPEDYRDLLVEVGRVPESIQGTYAVPPFPQGEITSQAEMQDVVDWMLDKGLIERNVSYEALVDPGFLPSR